MKQFFYKVIYSDALNPFFRGVNKMLYPILPSKVKLPPSGIITIKNEEGVSLKIKTNQTNFLTQLIYWEGGYLNFEYTPIFIKLVRKVNVFYDIGANIGYYSLLAVMENKDVKVVGFEPAEGPLHYYRENVKLNKIDNISIESIALSDKEGEIEFHEIRNKKYKYLKHNLAGESNAGSLTEGRNFVVNKVKTKTLDAYVAQSDIKPIDLIKIDTEGTEHFILNNAEIVLGEMKPIVICETLFENIESELDEIFKSYGYEFYNHVGDHLVKFDTIVRSEDNGVRNCFFVHPDKKDLIAEFVK